MKVMMIDIGNYASQRLRWVHAAADNYEVEVIPDVWDVHVWTPDVIGHYQRGGYDVFLFSTVATNRLQQIDIMEDLCNQGDIRCYFAEDDKGCVIHGTFDGQWDYTAIETERLAIEEAITHVQQLENLDDFFVTTDSKIFYDVCTKLSAPHKWIGDVHSVALH